VVAAIIKVNYKKTNSKENNQKMTMSIFVISLKRKWILGSTRNVRRGRLTPLISYLLVAQRGKRTQAGPLGLLVLVRAT
jgi:hypothetical protein